ncbi:hypothetical protein CSKR_111904 [Clonorchis sinensis]|uniref:Uncharacterized protein n=1 Tax=Clonorchis sinensis TaxID=79923 RepID=A0A419QA52_CLOSI|nr:hypothetical protein CSKR_111904 [Clonorchis sinensis]
MSSQIHGPDSWATPRTDNGTQTTCAFSSKKPNRVEKKPESASAIALHLFESNHHISIDGYTMLNLQAALSNIIPELTFNIVRNLLTSIINSARRADLNVMCIHTNNKVAELFLILMVVIFPLPQLAKYYRQPLGLNNLPLRSVRFIIINIIVINSMTSVFNTDALLPHNHNLFKSLILKERIKVTRKRLGATLHNHGEKLTTRSQLTLVSSHNLQRLQLGAVRITWSSSWKASSTENTSTFRDFFHTPLPNLGLVTSPLPPPRIGHGKRHCLRQTMVRHTQHMSQPTQLLVLDIFFNGSTLCTTENSLSNCLVTDMPTPTHTSYGSQTTIVEHLKTSQFRCSNRPSPTGIQQNSPHCRLIHTSLEIQGYTTLTP